MPSRTQRAHPSVSLEQASFRAPAEALDCAHHGRSWEEVDIRHSSQARRLVGVPLVGTGGGLGSILVSIFFEQWRDRNARVKPWAGVSVKRSGENRWNQGGISCKINQEGEAPNDGVRKNVRNQRTSHYQGGSRRDAQDITQQILQPKA